MKLLGELEIPNLICNTGFSFGQYGRKRTKTDKQQIIYMYRCKNIVDHLFLFVETPNLILNTYSQLSTVNRFLQCAPSFTDNIFYVEQERNFYFPWNVSAAEN